MIISSFFALMDDAAPQVRAEAVGVLANAFLGATLGAEAPEEVEAALSMVLDDPSPKVRQVLAIAFAEQRNVPRHIVLSLASDQPEVSALLIARSPLLTDADLIELARGAEGLALVAIALRPQVSGVLCAALVARGIPAIQLALARNPEAEIKGGDLLKIAQAPECTSETREAILARPHVPAMVRHALMVCVARSLGGFASQGGFMPEGRNARMIEDTVRDATISIAARQPGELKAFIAYLRHNAFLTPALILRSVLGGHLAFLTHALTELSELEHSRVTGLIKGRSVAALSALFRRADLPEFLENVLIYAVRMAQSQRETLPADGLSLAVIQAAQSSCIMTRDEESTRLLALLRRFEAEAARAQSRKIADDLLERVRKERLEFCAVNAPDHAAFRLNNPNAENVIDNNKLEHVVLDKPASTLSRHALAQMLELQPHLSILDMNCEPGDRDEIADEQSAMPLAIVDCFPANASEPEALTQSGETGAIRSSSKLKSLIAQWRLESQMRYPGAAPAPLAPANADDFGDWQIRGAA